MRRQTFTIDHLTITVREGIGSDAFDEDIVMYNLGDVVKNHPLMRVNKFIAFVVQTERIEGNLGFEWPSSVVDRDRMPLAYERWRELPRSILMEWDRQIEAVNTPPGDPAIQPMNIPAGESLAPT